MKFPIRQLDHVAINCRSLEKSLHFYTEVLGLPITQREVSKPGIEFFLDAGTSLLGLIQTEAQDPAHFFNKSGPGANHFSFRIPAQDFDRTLEALKAQEVTILAHKKREKSWSLYFQDPDGNQIEMTAWPGEDRIS